MRLLGIIAIILTIVLTGLFGYFVGQKAALLDHDEEVIGRFHVFSFEMIGPRKAVISFEILGGPKCTGELNQFGRWNELECE